MISGPAFVAPLKGVLGERATFTFTTKGNSMSPFLRDGDVVAVRPLFGVSPRRGEVVAFVSPANDKVVVHRIVGGTRGAFVIKGDNLLRADGVISRESIIGRVVGVRRNGKSISFGLGPERFFIASLSRMYLLLPLLLPVRIAVRFFRRSHLV